jgi:hypothetical protein
MTNKRNRRKKKKMMMMMMMKICYKHESHIKDLYAILVNPCTAIYPSTHTHVFNENKTAAHAKCPEIFPPNVLSELYMA